MSSLELADPYEKQKSASSIPLTPKHRRAFAGVGRQKRGQSKQSRAKARNEAGGEGRAHVHLRRRPREGVRHLAGKAETENFPAAEVHRGQVARGTYRF